MPSQVTNYARRVFDRMEKKNVLSYTLLCPTFMQVFGEAWRKQGVDGEPGPSQIQVAAGTLDVDDDAILCMCFIS